MNFKFFQHTKCEYFPCHDSEYLNCLFCFCPLYNLGDCGGDYSFTPKGIKDCSDCLLPHSENGYDFIINKLM